MIYFHVIFFPNRVQISLFFFFTTYIYFYLIFFVYFRNIFLHASISTISIFSPNCYIFFFPWFFSWIFLTWPFLKMNFYMIHIFFFKILLFTNCSFIFMWFSFHITNMWYFSLTRFIDFFFFFTSIYMSFGFIYHILLTWCVYLSSVSGHDIMKYTFTCEKH